MLNIYSQVHFFWTHSVERNTEYGRDVDYALPLGLYCDDDEPNHAENDEKDDEGDNDDLEEDGERV